MSKRTFDKPSSTRDPQAETRIGAETANKPSAARGPEAQSPIRAGKVEGTTVQGAFLPKRGKTGPQSLAPARIGGRTPVNDNAVPPGAPFAPIRAELVRRGVRRHCREAETAKGLTCDNPDSPPNRDAVRILTNLPEIVPVLPGEIALLETYWGAILDLMAANDNDAE